MRAQNSHCPETAGLSGPTMIMFRTIHTFLIMGDSYIPVTVGAGFSGQCVRGGGTHCEAPRESPQHRTVEWEQ